MNRRERFTQTMSHQSLDRPPIDIGATTLTSMSPHCQDNLRRFLGFSGKPIPTNSGVDERILKWAGTDFRAVGAIVDLPSVHTRRISSKAYVDCWGIRREAVGQYEEITYHPLRGATREDLTVFQWPEARVNERLLEQWGKQAKELKQENKYVVIAEHPIFGILELGCWMCGYDEFLMKMAIDKDFVRVFFDRVFDIQMKVIDQYYSVVGPYIDLTTSGDDFGMQTGPLISPQMFGELITPYFKPRIARTKELGRCYYWHHSCGSVFALLAQIIECGVDILNPLQTSANHMDPKELKLSFGDRLVFWGGVDVQQFLRSATPQQVHEYVLTLIATLGNGGGYVIAPAHNMQDDIPPENIVALVETIRRKIGTHIS